VAVKRGQFKTKAKKIEAEKEDSMLDKHFNRATSEYEKFREPLGGQAILPIGQVS